MMFVYKRGTYLDPSLQIFHDLQAPLPFILQLQCSVEHSVLYITIH